MLEAIMTEEMMKIENMIFFGHLDDKITPESCQQSVLNMFDILVEWQHPSGRIYSLSPAVKYQF